MSKSIRDILYEISDEADHILGTDAENPLEVARVNAKHIKTLCREGVELATEIHEGLTEVKTRMELTVPDFVV